MSWITRLHARSSHMSGKNVMVIMINKQQDKSKSRTRFWSRGVISLNSQVAFWTCVWALGIDGIKASDGNQWLCCRLMHFIGRFQVIAPPQPQPPPPPTTTTTTTTTITTTIMLAIIMMTIMMIITTTTTNICLLRERQFPQKVLYLRSLMPPPPPYTLSL